MLLCWAVLSSAELLKILASCSAMSYSIDSARCKLRKVLYIVSTHTYVFEYACFKLDCFFKLEFFYNFIYIFHLSESTEIPAYVTKCPSNGLCSRLPPDCMICNTNYSCIYGKPATFDCRVKPHVHCVVSNLLFLKLILSNVIKL